MLFLFGGGCRHVPLWVGLDSLLDECWLGAQWCAELGVAFVLLTPPEVVGEVAVNGRYGLVGCEAEFGGGGFHTVGDEVFLFVVAGFGDDAAEGLGFEEECFGEGVAAQLNGPV